MCWGGSTPPVVVKGGSTPRSSTQRWGGSTPPVLALQKNLGALSLPVALGTNQFNEAVFSVCARYPSAILKCPRLTPPSSSGEELTEGGRPPAVVLVSWFCWRGSTPVVRVGFVGLQRWGVNHWTSSSNLGGSTPPGVPPVYPIAQHPH